METFPGEIASISYPNSYEERKEGLKEILRRGGTKEKDVTEVFSDECKKGEFYLFTSRTKWTRKRGKVAPLGV